MDFFFLHPKHQICVKKTNLQIFALMQTLIVHLWSTKGEDIIRMVYHKIIMSIHHISSTPNKIDSFTLKYNTPALNWGNDAATIQDNDLGVISITVLS